MEKYLLPLNLQLFAEGEESGVEEVPAAEGQTNEPESGVESKVAAEPEGVDKAFAKRLSAEREKWETEKQKELEQYKDYDIHKKATEYLQRTHGISDLMTLKEQLELTELQERAEEQNMPVEVLQRINELEQKAAKGEELEKQQQQQQEYQSFRVGLEKFATEKNVDADELHKFMFENQISNPDMAYRAMRFEDAESKKEELKKEAIKEYLESKKAPKVEGSGAAGVVAEGVPKTWEEAQQRALSRFRAANQQQ